MYSNSGHAWQLNLITNGQPPDYPYSSVPEPPEGYTWDDILYVIGGYRWKARFMNTEGYIITGPPGSGASSTYANQYNLENPRLRTSEQWVSYHADEENQTYDCGECHTTGYNPLRNPEDTPGLVGIWAEDGIACEECHGPGGLHVTNPLGYGMQIDRDAEACTSCHIRGSVDELSLSEGYIEHHDSYGDLFPGKHAVLDCVTCHNPHTGVVQLSEADEDTTLVACENCHFDKAANQKIERHTSLLIDCVRCHMPYMIKSAVGEEGAYSGDIRTHQVSINSSQIGQVSEDGTVLPQIGLDFACRQCHGTGIGTEKTDEELIDNATGYHEPQPLETEAP
jgi:hypothetical protein